MAIALSTHYCRNRASIISKSDDGLKFLWASVARALVTRFSAFLGAIAAWLLGGSPLGARKAIHRPALEADPVIEGATDRGIEESRSPGSRGAGGVAGDLPRPLRVWLRVWLAGRLGDIALSSTRAALRKRG
ncbi:MAG: hypothetical protein IPK82_38470 [Polyangiaceae bacterium]|nr:hypothetical protein [Polyangiaceae bacterium]